MQRYRLAIPSPHHIQIHHHAHQQEHGYELVALGEDLVRAEVAGHHGGCHQQGSDAEGYLEQHEDEGPPQGFTEQRSIISVMVIPIAIGTNQAGLKEPYGKQHEQYIRYAAMYKVYVQLVADEAVVGEGIG